MGNVIEKIPELPFMTTMVTCDVSHEVAYKYIPSCRKQKNTIKITHVTFRSCRLNDVFRQRSLKLLFNRFILPREQ